MSRYGGPSSDPEKANEMVKEIDAVFNNKPLYQRKALELYGIRVPDASTPIMTVIREAYLDFYSKSLQPEHNH